VTGCLGVTNLCGRIIDLSSIVIAPIDAPVPRIPLAHSSDSRTTVSSGAEELPAHMRKT
jgi:hypothetical protein